MIVKILFRCLLGYLLLVAGDTMISADIHLPGKSDVFLIKYNVINGKLKITIIWSPEFLSCFAHAIASANCKRGRLRCFLSFGHSRNQTTKANSVTWEETIVFKLALKGCLFF